MPASEKGPPSDPNLAALTEEMRRFTDGLARLQTAVKDARSETGTLTGEVRSLASRVARLDRAVPKGLQQDSDQSSASKPVPADPANPTSEEIRRHILYQLYRTDCWNGKHTSREHLRRGYMSRVEQRRVWEVIQQLQSEGALIPHGKSPDEHYSLNPQVAQRIYRELGISQRTSTAETGQSPPSEDPSASIARAECRQLPTFVEVGRFENTARSLRTSIEEVGRAASGLSERLAGQSRAFNEVGSRVECRISLLEGRLEALEQRPNAQNTGLTAPPVNEGSSPVRSERQNL
jgi:hypothetical protein